MNTQNMDKLLEIAREQIRIFDRPSMKVLKEVMLQAENANERIKYIEKKFITDYNTEIEGITLTTEEWVK